VLARLRPHAARHEDRRRERNEWLHEDLPAARRASDLFLGGWDAVRGESWFAKVDLEYSPPF